MRWAVAFDQAAGHPKRALQVCRVADRPDGERAREEGIIDPDAGPGAARGAVDDHPLRAAAIGSGDRQRLRAVRLQLVEEGGQVLVVNQPRLRVQISGNMLRRVPERDHQAGAVHGREAGLHLQVLQLFLEGRRHVAASRHARLIAGGLLAQLLDLLLEVLIGVFQRLIVGHQGAEAVAGKLCLPDRALRLQRQPEKAAEDQAQGGHLEDPGGRAGPGLGSSGFVWSCGANCHGSQQQAYMGSRVARVDRTEGITPRGTRG